MTTTALRPVFKNQVSKTGPVWKSHKDVTPRPCLWMQAGVTGKKSCNQFYDCTGCRYDAAMEKGAAAGRHVSWQEAMRRQPGSQRICRHAMTGRIRKLHDLLEESSRMKAADGGDPVFGILDHVPDTLRDRLIHSFLDPGSDAVMGSGR